MRKLIPVLLLIAAGAFATGPAMAGSDKKDDGKSKSSSANKSERDGKGSGKSDAGEVQAGPKTEGPNVREFGDDSREGHDIEFEVKNFDDYRASRHEPEYYEPEHERHDELPEPKFESGQEGEFGWEMAYHVLGDMKDDAHNPEYGQGPGKLGEHESLRCDYEFINLRPTPTPVPGAVWTLGSGIAVLVARRRRRA